MGRAVRRYQVAFVALRVRHHAGVTSRARCRTDKARHPSDRPCSAAACSEGVHPPPATPHLRLAWPHLVVRAPRSVPPCSHRARRLRKAKQDFAFHFLHCLTSRRIKTVHCARQRQTTTGGFSAILKPQMARPRQYRGPTGKGTRACGVSTVAKERITAMAVMARRLERGRSQATRPM